MCRVCFCIYISIYIYVCVCVLCVCISVCVAYEFTHTRFARVCNRFAPVCVQHKVSFSCVHYNWLFTQVSNHQRC